MATTAAQDSGRGGVATSLKGFVERHQVLAYFVLTYALTWSVWGIAAIDPESGPGQAAFLLGIFGPATASLVLTRVLGKSFRDWFAPILRWRVSPRWYLVALTLPMALPALAGAIYAGLGNDVDYGQVTTNLAGYIPGLLFVALIGGGNEEPGWRGFALPRLQLGFGPNVASLILGTVWAFWHLPALLASPDLQHDLHGIEDWAFVIGMSATNIVCNAFILTWVYNHTHSVLVCIIMHASFNTANATFIPLHPDLIEGAVYQEVQVIMTVVLLTAVALLIAATRGRLGFFEDESASELRESLRVGE